MERAMKTVNWKNVVWMAALSLCLPVVGATKTDPKTEKEILAAMDVLKHATINRDVAAFTRLAHPDITYCHSSGITQDKAVLLDYVPTMTTVYLEYQKPVIRVYGNVALVNTVTDIRGRGSENTPFLINSLYVWVKGTQGWQLLARHVIRMPRGNGTSSGGNENSSTSL